MTYKRKQTNKPHGKRTKLAGYVVVTDRGEAIVKVLGLPREQRAARLEKLAQGRYKAAEKWADQQVDRALAE